MILALALAAGLAVTDLGGQPVDPFAATGSGGPVRALVLIFIHPDCPVSNRYIPELNRLYREYSRQHVEMWAVYSGIEGLERPRTHHAEYGLLVPALVDPGLTIADRARATMTPEVAVYDARGSSPPRLNRELVYRGRIDDRAPSVGVWRPAPSVRDLADVLQRIENGEVLTGRTTQAVGCYLRP